MTGVSLPAGAARACAAGGAPWGVVVQGAALLAVGMGVGRFAYTPILPLMEHQAGMSASAGADLATANYAGYLAGALTGIVAPSVVRSKLALRASLLTIVVTLALMPVTVNASAWLALRLIAGIASALLFVIASSAMLARLRHGAHHLVGWGFGGVGLGIALSGVLVLAVQSTSPTSWRASWWGAAGLAAALSVIGWTMQPDPAGQAIEVQRHGDLPRTHRWFAALLTSYTLEGIGYIIAGTFLVAAISQNSPGWLGGGAWVVVGLAATPAAALFASLARYRPRSTLMLCALVIQVIGIALPSLAGGIAPALVAAVLFGNTFIAVSATAVAIGAHLQFPRSVAILTAGYSIGQLLGPLIVAPLLGSGYQDALLVGAAITAGAAAAAAALRIRFPHRVGVMVEPSRPHVASSAARE